MISKRLQELPTSTVSREVTLDGQGGSRTELLCTVRGILKKIKQSVLVGDRVRVAGIDWDDRRGARHSIPILCAFKAS